MDHRSIQETADFGRPPREHAVSARDSSAPPTTPSGALDPLGREVAVERLAEARGVKLTRDGKQVVGRCPFHDDAGATLAIDPAANTWHCAVCDTGGGPVEWIMRAEGVSRRHAVELLRADRFQGSAAVVRRATTQKLDVFAATDEPDDAVLARVVGFYAETLRTTSDALDYLRARKLDSPDIVEHFRLGFANRSLGYRLPLRNRKAGAALRSQLERLGVYRATGHEHLAGSLVVPVVDEGGRIVDLYGRKITAKLHAGTPQHLSLGDGPREIFNLGGVQDHEVILCKSILDVLSFWAAGYKHAITTFGVKGFTALHREAFERHGAKKVFIAFDRAKEGDSAARDLADELAADGKQVFQLIFPWGMDPNDYLRAGESFDELVRAAQWMGGARSAQVPETIAKSRPSAPQPELAMTAEAPLPPPPATPRPAPGPARDSTPVEAGANEVVMRFGDRTWRVRGHEGCTSLASIRVNVRVATDYAFFTDTVDILSARARASFLKQAHDELEIEERILKSDLGRVVLHIEELVDAALRARLEPKAVTPTMSDTERADALALLRDPKLVERVVADFARCGIVGESDNALLGYLVTVSRRLDEPMAAIFQSASAAGKTSLLDAIQRFVPEEEQVSYSALTGQSLFYMGGIDLKHKVLAVAEEAGVSQAAYALRVLQSSGELSIASTGKDQATGRLSAHEYRVQGPVAILMTTTALDVDDELLNRCITLAVDESPEQTRAIQEQQRKARTLDGLLARHERLAIERLHQNAQRLLAPVAVVNPFAPELTFAATTTRARRDQKKLLTLIDTIAYLHQHQRPTKTAESGGGASFRYVEVTRADVELAMKLAGHLFQDASGDLPPQTGKMLLAISATVDAEAEARGIEPGDVRFTRRELRERFGWSATQTRVHLDRLTELEHVVRYRGANGQRYVYGVARATTTTTWRGVAGTWRPEKSQVEANDVATLREPGGLAERERSGGRAAESHRSHAGRR